MKKIDIGGSAIIDMIEMSNYGILLADYNKRIIIFDIDNLGAIKGDISLEEKPYGLTEINEHCVGVSVGHKHILLVDMIKEVVIHMISVSVDEDILFWGITFFDEHFFTAAKDRIVKINQHSCHSQEILTLPHGWIYYLQIHDRKLFFTNYKAKSFLCATLKGDIIFECSNDKIKGPYGFTRHSDNSFYVSDWVANKVHKIDEDGNNSEIVLTKSDGIFKPRVVLFEAKHKYMLVACNGGKLLLQTRRRVSLSRSTSNSSHDSTSSRRKSNILPIDVASNANKIL